jgi:hypothetical protein
VKEHHSSFERWSAEVLIKARILVPQQINNLGRRPQGWSIGKSADHSSCCAAKASRAGNAVSFDAFQASEGAREALDLPDYLMRRT